MITFVWILKKKMYLLKMLNHDKYILISEFGLYSRVLFLHFILFSFSCRNWNHQSRLKRISWVLDLRYLNGGTNVTMEKNKERFVGPFLMVNWLYLDFPDTWIYKPKWYLVWNNKSCYHFYPIFIFEENLTSSNLTALKKEEAKLRKFYEKNRHIFDNIHESLQRVCLNHVCTSDWTTT